MQLALDGQDDVQVLLGLDEVPQVGGDHLRNPAVGVGSDPQGGCLPRLLLLRLSLLLEGLVVLVLAPDEVRHESLAHRAQLVHHGEAGLVLFHHAGKFLKI